MDQPMYYVRVRGRVLGPFSLEQLRALTRRGQLGRFHEVSADRHNWQSAAALDGLFPAPGGGNEPEAAEVQLVPAAAAAPPEDWYYFDPQGRRQGPVSRPVLAALLQAGTVDDATLVWKQGLADWAPLSATELKGSAFSAGLGGGPATYERTLGWRRVRAGLLLVIIAASLFSGLFVLGAFGYTLAMLGDAGTSVRIALGMNILLGVLYLIAKIVAVVGYGFGAAAPADSGARGLGLTTLILAITSVVVTLLTPLFGLVAGTTLPLARDGTGVAGFMGVTGVLLLLNGLLVVAYTTLFLLFLRAAAAGLRAYALAQRILYLAIFYGVFVLLGMILGCMTIFTLPSLAEGGAPVSGPALGVWLSFVLVLGGLGLAWWVWYVVTLFQVRRAVGERLKQLGG